MKLIKSFLIITCLSFCSICTFGQNRNIAATRAYCDNNMVIATQNAIANITPLINDVVDSAVENVRNELTSYNDFTNKPSINNVVLQGNLSLGDLGITNCTCESGSSGGGAVTGDYATVEYVGETITNSLLPYATTSYVNEVFSNISSTNGGGSVVSGSSLTTNDVCNIVTNGGFTIWEFVPPTYNGEQLIAQWDGYDWEILTAESETRVGWGTSDFDSTRMEIDDDYIGTAYRQFTNTLGLTTKSYVDNKILIAINSSNEMFSNAVLSVGVNVQTNELSVLTEFLSSQGINLSVGEVSSIGSLICVIICVIAYLIQYTKSVERYSLVTLGSSDSNMYDRSMNYIVPTSNTQFSFPDAVNGKARDFQLSAMCEGTDYQINVRLPAGSTCYMDGSKISTTVIRVAAAGQNTMYVFTEISANTFYINKIFDSISVG